MEHRGERCLRPVPSTSFIGQDVPSLTLAYTNLRREVRSALKSYKRSEMLLVRVGALPQFTCLPPRLCARYPQH